MYFTNSKFKKFKILFSTLVVLGLGFLGWGYYSMAATVSKSKTTVPNLKNGLIGHWTFDGADVTANTATDKSGQGNNGIKKGGLSSVTGKIGQAMKFNGTSGIVSTSDNAFEFGTTQDFSINFWIKSSAASRILAKRVGGNGFLLYGPTASTFGVYLESAFKLDYPNIWTGTWQHVVVVFDRDASSTTYINGVNVGSFNIAGIDLNNSAEFTIGGDSNPLYFNGSLDDVRVYNRVLSPVEVQELYKMGGGKINKTDVIKPTLKTGLAGHWTFDGADVTANTTTDKSGNGLHAGRKGVTSVVTGKIGQALNFNGTTGYVSTTNIISVSSSTVSHTYTAWVYVKSFSNTLQWVINNGANGDGSSLVLGNSASNCGANRAAFYYQGGVAVTCGSTNLAVNTWYHIAAVYNAATSKVTFYLNGKADGTSAALTSWAVSTAPVVLGRWGANNSWYFGGKIDDARIYSRALSPAEIQEMYRQGGGVVNKSNAAVPRIKNGLIGHWTFDGGDTTTNTTTDKSGQGNHGNRTLTTPIRGKIGQAMSFNGTTSYIPVGTDLYETQNVGTISAWINIKSLAATNYVFSSSVTAGSNLLNMSVLTTGELAFQHYVTPANNAFKGNTILTANQWYFVTVTSNGSSWSLYVNGVPQTLTSIVGTNDGGWFNDLGAGTHNTEIGVLRYEGGNTFFNGKIDDVRVYNRVFSPAEVMAMYKAGR